MLIQVNLTCRLNLALDQQMFSEVLPPLSIPEKVVKSSRRLSVETLDDGLLDCFVRLTRLLDTPSVRCIDRPAYRTRDTLPASIRRARIPASAECCYGEC